MTKLFKSLNISLIAAIIMIIATALNFAQEVRFSTIMPTGSIGGGGNVVRGVLGVLGNPVGGWGPSGTDWQTHNPGNDWLVVGRRLIVGYFEPFTLTDNFAVDGTARIADGVTLEENLTGQGGLDIGGDLFVTGDIDASSTDITSLIGINGLQMNVGALFANADLVNMTGNVYQQGNVIIHIYPDYVFEPDYKLETIEKHAKFMWEKKRLPAIPLAEKTNNGRYRTEIGGQQRGILEELEKAHIYITQLKEMLGELKKRITRLENND